MHDFNDANDAIRRRQLADHARINLESATELLKICVNPGAATSDIGEILWSLWNGPLYHKLTRLDINEAEAVIAIIAARTYMGDESDPLFREIIKGCGSEPPHDW